MVRYGPLSGQKTSEPKNSKRARDRPLPVGWGVETMSKSQLCFAHRQAKFTSTAKKITDILSVAAGNHGLLPAACSPGLLHAWAVASRLCQQQALMACCEHGQPWTDANMS